MEMPNVSKHNSDFYLRIWFWNDSVKYVVNIERNMARYKCELNDFNSRKSDRGEVIITHYRVNNIGSMAAWVRSFKNGLK